MKLLAQLAGYLGVEQFDKVEVRRPIEGMTAGRRPERVVVEQGTYEVVREQWHRVQIFVPTVGCDVLVPSKCVERLRVGVVGPSVRVVRLDDSSPRTGAEATTGHEAAPDAGPGAESPPLLPHRDWHPSLGMDR